MAEVMEKVDLFVGDGDLDLYITNLTGHPTAAFPGSSRESEGRQRPRSINLTGRLYDESTLLAVAHAYQQATGDHLRRPPIENYLTEDGKAEDS